MTQERLQSLIEGWLNDAEELGLGDDFAAEFVASLLGDLAQHSDEWGAVLDKAVDFTAFGGVGVALELADGPLFAALVKFVSSIRIKRDPAKKERRQEKKERRRFKRDRAWLIRKLIDITPEDGTEETGRELHQLGDMLMREPE